MGWLTAGDACDTKGESDRPDVDLWHAFLRAVESDRPDWHVSAACRRVDPHPFFPDHGEHPDVALEAKALCRTCPVQASCLAESLDGPTALPGVWGGAGPSDRKKLRKARAARTAA